MPLVQLALAYSWLCPKCKGYIGVETLDPKKPPPARVECPVCETEYEATPPGGVPKKGK